MADPLDVVGEALVTYWTSPLPLAVVLVCGASMGTLLYVFVTNARNARLRVSLLTGLYALTIFFWLFVAASLILCVAQARTVAYRTWGVPLAVAGAVLAALTASSAISLLVWRRAAAAVLRRFRPMPLGERERWAQAYVGLLAEFEGVTTPRVALVDRPEPLAMAVAGRAPTILVSRGLFDRLDREELETTLGHELMHLKHRDAEFKVFSRVFSRILFFDPFSKFFDPAVHREREYLADEMGARSTGRPAALASALLKLSRSPSPREAWGLSILGPSTGIFSRSPPLQERVRRLLRLSDLRRPASCPTAAGGKH
ncbi:MAG: M56 family metallopeptidase [Methanobacteriota archaeon]